MDADDGKLRSDLEPPGGTFFPGVFLSCVSAVRFCAVLTSCGSSAAHVTCCVGDLCVDSGDMVAIFATRARCSAIGVVVISGRVCVSARVLVRDEGGASTCPRRWLVNVSRDLSGGVGAIVGRVRGRGALRVNGTIGPFFVSRKSRSLRERDRETTRANASGREI